MAKFDVERLEGYVANHLRIFLSLTMGVAVSAGLIAMLVFFFYVRGEEQTLVPDVRNKELTEALLELQAKELYPRIQLRYSQSAYDRGTILEQDPKPGAIVKAGRRVRLVVSQGVIINTVENYRGRNIEEVRIDIRTLYPSASMPLITLKEPFMYEYSPQSAGTILEQHPEPGTQISGPITLEFVISRGPPLSSVPTPNLLGLKSSEVLEILAEQKLAFSFSLQPPQEDEQIGTVVSQNPGEHSALERNQAISLAVAAPETDVWDGQAFGLFAYLLPENPYPLPVTLEAAPPGEAKRIAIAEIEFGGGILTIPYAVPVGSTLILSMLNRELYREETLPQSLSFDQL